MAIAQISPKSLLASPSHINPLAQPNNHAAMAQASQDAKKTVQQAKTDTVTISRQALQMASKAHAKESESARKVPERK